MAEPNVRRDSTKNLSDHVKTCSHTLQHSSLLTKQATSDTVNPKNLELWFKGMTFGIHKA